MSGKKCFMKQKDHALMSMFTCVGLEHRLLFMTRHYRHTKYKFTWSSTLCNVLFHIVLNIIYFSTRVDCNGHKGSSSSRAGHKNSRDKPWTSSSFFHVNFHIYTHEHCLFNLCQNLLASFLQLSFITKGLAYLSLLSFLSRNSQSFQTYTKIILFVKYPQPIL